MITPTEQTLTDQLTHLASRVRSLEMGRRIIRYSTYTATMVSPPINTLNSPTWVRVDGKNDPVTVSGGSFITQLAGVFLFDIDISYGGQQLTRAFVELVYDTSYRDVSPTEDAGHLNLALALPANASVLCRVFQGNTYASVPLRAHVFYLGPT